MTKVKIINSKQFSNFNGETYEVIKQNSEYYYLELLYDCGIFKVRKEECDEQWKSNYPET